ncbi:MAG: ATP-dependent DNA helicase RecG [Treponema sp.]|jgi:ATP-dependent DNA helicase RecG|nr:ATP-dependent DNA helicase RecG [Treponema sp.]
MFLRELTMSIDHIKGAGPASIHALARAGITGVAGLLCRYPRDWEDRSKTILLKDFNLSPVCTAVRVLAHDWFGFGNTKALKVYVEDESARAVLVCFNRSFMDKVLLVGNYYRLWGVFHYKFGELQSSTFEVEALQKKRDGEPGMGESSGSADPGKQSTFGRILPVYPLNTGLSQGMLRKFIQQALAQYAGPVEDELPRDIMIRYGLLPKSKALKAIHFPESLEELEKAKQTLIYEELFYLEVLVGRRAMERRAVTGSRGRGNEQAALRLSPLQQRLLERLPFSLTSGQEEAAAEINRDMERPYPMARLLQGDVGSGKTLVSFLAALRVAEQGGQAALMAPTELLARQHAENAARLLEPLGIRPAFLTGNIRAAGRSALLKSLAAGEIDLVVGTHALFSRDVAYNNLRLVVIDEQHRFGVVQRQAVMAKGDHPGLLMMSATPIPRTLALTVFGDMDVSVIRDLPPGRKPVRTHLARESNEAKVYDFVRNELAAGRQAYFVYPLIEADTNRGLKDAESMAVRLGESVFPDYPVAMIHSRLDEEEKRKTMEHFRKGDIRILAATSVVEVGVDVPNATCMVIEHAERFGLSALHQLRGRVGRGTDQSYCFLVYSDALTDEGKARLKVMLENADGFVIAEEDLKLRGPGHIAGTEQSGYFVLGIADPLRDASRLEQARSDAFSMLERDPSLSLPEHRCVAQVLNRAPPFGNIGL